VLEEEGQGITLNSFIILLYGMGLEEIKEFKKVIYSWLLCPVPPDIIRSWFYIYRIISGGTGPWHSKDRCKTTPVISPPQEGRGLELHRSYYRGGLNSAYYCPPEHLLRELTSGEQCYGQ